MMDVLNKVIDALADILDVNPDAIGPDTYLIRDLEAESIDLLELAVVLNAEFQIEIDDDEIFLRTLRIYLDDPKSRPEDMGQYLMEKYPYLTRERIREILTDLPDGPVLKVKDLVSYIDWKN
jgi:acyl carrier protein